MAKSTTQDTRVAYVAGFVFIVIALGLGATWYFMRGAADEEKRMEVSYPTFGPINMQTHGAGVRASIAVQTRSGNSEWVAQNRSRLDGIFQKILADTDPQTIVAPNGIQSLQIVLKNEANAALNTNNVEAVFLTDFLMVQDN